MTNPTYSLGSLTGNGIAAVFQACGCRFEVPAGRADDLLRVLLRGTAEPQAVDLQAIARLTDEALRMLEQYTAEREGHNPKDDRKRVEWMRERMSQLIGGME